MEMEMFHVGQEMASSLHDISNEELYSFAKLREDPANNAQIELFTYTCFLLFKRTGLMEYLERAIRRAEAWVAGTANDDPDRTRRSEILDTMSARMVERRDMLEDANLPNLPRKRISQAFTPDEIDIQSYLRDQAARLAQRYQRNGVMKDLEEAIRMAEQAINMTATGHTDLVGSLSDLGGMLALRYEQTGAMDDLNCAVEIVDEAVKATPLDHSDRADLLSNLESCLGTRFERIGAIDDLNRAIEVADEAVTATPPDHPNRARRLSNLGNWLGRRFERIGAMDNLNRAVEIVDEAVRATSPDHPDRTGLLSNLGSWLGTRFLRTGAMDDLNRAIEVADEAMMATPLDHPDRAGRLNNLGNCLGTRFERIGAMDDLNRAVEIADEAVRATPPDHPDRAGLLGNLGNWLGRRFEWTEAEKDIEQSLLSFKEGWNCENVTPIIRINLARKTATLLASQSNWEESSVILQGAVKILPMVSQRSLENTDKQYMLRRSAGLASIAAAIALKTGKDPGHALELLELGRGVIAGLLLEMRTDISDLKQKHRKIAEDFESLRDELDSPTSGAVLSTPSDDALSLVSRANRRREAGQKFDGIIARIRGLPGFRNFLLPLSAGELMAAADLGSIVVVNASPYRCDAFVIERHRIRLLELPNLSLQEVNEKVQQLGSDPLYLATPSLSEWLWNVAAGPIVEALGFTQTPSDDNWPHVWWILTGALSHLPLHAAGRHTQGSTETVLDRVMSSYSSSVKALIYGRRHSVRKSAGPVSDHALLVAMPETPCQTALPSATDEVDMLNGLFPLLQMTPVKPPEFKREVLEQLRTCKIFHFAGHGLSDPLEPSRSCLLLKDWKDNPLTVGDLRDSRFQENSPFLGYLSACSTGANKADELIDEGIHLISACQLAGFRHVVGTLWEVSDRHCVNVAKVLYETLRVEGMTDVAVYRGLHRAIRALRDSDNAMRREMREERDAKLLGDESHTRKREKPLYWVPYIHFGV